MKNEITNAINAKALNVTVTLENLVKNLKNINEARELVFAEMNIDQRKAYVKKQIAAKLELIKFIEEM